VPARGQQFRARRVEDNNNPLDYIHNLPEGTLTERFVSSEKLRLRSSRWCTIVADKYVSALSARTAQYCSAEVLGRNDPDAGGIAFGGTTTIALAADLLDNNGAGPMAELDTYLVRGLG